MRGRDWGAVVAVLLLASVLRLVGIAWGQPDPRFDSYYSPRDLLHDQTPLQADEYIFVSFSLKMLRDGELVPRFYHNPTFVHRFNALVFWITGTPQQLAPTVRDGLTMRHYAPFRLYVMGRAHSVLASVFAAAITMAIARVLAGRRAMLHAGLLMAISFPLVQHAHYTTSNSMGLMWVMLCLYASLRALRQNSTHWLLAAGVCAGFAFGSRYNGGVVLGVMGLAGLVLWWRARTWRPALALLAGCAAFAAAFLLSTPAVLLDRQTFWDDLRFISSQYLSSGSGSFTPISAWEGLRMEWHYLAVFGVGVPALLPIAGGARQLWRKNAAFAGVLLAYVAAYSLLILRTVRPAGADQLVILAIGALAVLYGIGMAWLLARRALVWRVGLAIVGIVLPLSQSLQFTAQRKLPDTREVFLAWLHEQLPVGARVGLINSYNVPLDPTRTPYWQIYALAQEVDWTTVAEADYLLISDAGEFFRARTGVPIARTLPKGARWAAGVARPRWAGDDWALHTASYWHNPALDLYCLTPAACAALAR